MAATAFTPTAVGHGGLDLDTSAVTPTQTTGHTCPGGAGVCLYVKNASASPITVTLHYTPTVDGNAVASRTVTVTNAKASLIPVQNTYADPATGLVTIDFSAFTSVTAQAVLVSGA